MDPSEFEALYESCKGALARYVYYKMPSKADGEDVLQEVFLAAYRGRDAVKSPASFKPWLIKIAANKCNDFYRMRAKRLEIPLDEIPQTSYEQSRYGVSVSQIVRETLDELAEKDKQILFLYYLKNLPQADIAKQLGIPLGTVKSRLHTAKQSFKETYPFPPVTKGEKLMKTLPLTLPEYKITKSDLPPFSVKWEEVMGWFIVPRVGEKLSWAMYDLPKRARTEVYELEVTGRASVHGIEGVEITAREKRGGEHESLPQSRNLTRTLIAQLTDTHCRILAESHYENDVKRFFTFLDADDFLPNWGFGKDNCGNEVNLKQKGTICKDGNTVTVAPAVFSKATDHENGGQQTAENAFLLDVVGRYEVEINGKKYDTICVMDIECYENGIATEQFIDQNGHTVLWRRFNKDDWQLARYKKTWSEQLPDNERLVIDGQTYVHWYDCITDYIV